MEMEPLEIRQIHAPPAPLRLYMAALMSVRKKNRVAPMPAISLVRPDLSLDAGHVARYAALCGFQAAHGVPFTYPHMLAFPLHMMLMADSRFPYAMLGMVHLANAVRQHAPLSPDQLVSVEVRCGVPLAHEKGQAFTLCTQMHADGALAWESTSTYLRTGIRDPLGLPYQSRIAEVQAARAMQEWTVEADIGRRYGAVSGDLNPIHMNRFAAMAFGFQRAIAHGMCTKARALAALLPARAIDSGEASIEFKTPLFLPGKATLWADSYTEAAGQTFEVKDGRGEKPHLRGVWRS